MDCSKKNSNYFVKNTTKYGTYWGEKRKKKKEKEKKVWKTMIRDKMWRIFGDNIIEELIEKLMENSWANIIGKSLLGTIPLDNSKAGKTFLKSLFNL